ncbi:hypothetical protein Taro_048034 [Colocasia esculenta]|uniref:CCHC-type domain-containing protein n=1 Tax=Colocasia esculenta TaxID=4460 RepID=A0A843X7L9_COLES|nr:hypothetical protein [Colocasia esculenta]
MPQALKFEMADRRDCGGGGDDPEESTQRMIERIWESLTDIRRRMDQQAPEPLVAVPPGDGETVSIVSVPLPPRVEWKKQLRGQLRWRGVFGLVRWANLAQVVFGYRSSQWVRVRWGQKLKQAFKGKGRGWGGRQQFQQGRGRPEVEESQQSTARQPIIPPGYRCYNCNQPGHLIRNCPYPSEYGYGRGVQQQQQPQQFQQPQESRGRGAPQQRGRGRNIGLPKDSSLTPFSLSLALFSRPLLPHYFQQLQKVSWRIMEREVVTNQPRKRRSEGWEYLRYQPRVFVKLIAEDLGVNID